MKTPLFVLAAAAAAGLALATPQEARAGGVHVDLHIGVPAVVHHPHVIHRPVVVYHPRVIHRPHGHYRHHFHPAHRHGHHHFRGGGYRHSYAPVYQHPRAIGRIGLNSRLQQQR